MDKGKAKSILTPDSRKILLFLAIPVCTVAILLSGPSLFPVGSSAEIVLVIPQIFLGTFLALVTAPFGIVTSMFRAFGIDLFYSTGIIAKTGLIVGILGTILWGYTMSCLVIFTCRRLKGRGRK